MDQSIFVINTRNNQLNYFKIEKLHLTKCNYVYIAKQNQVTLCEEAEIKTNERSLYKNTKIILLQLNFKKKVTRQKH